MELREKELYQEVEFYIDDIKIGSAEISMKDKMLSRFFIETEYRDKGYGTQIVQMLKEKYGINNLWVEADNKRAIHVYEKCGFKLGEPTMYKMEIGESNV